MEVKTALALDSQTLNLLLASDLAELLITGVAGSGVGSDGVDRPPVVSAYAIRELTGKKILLTPRETEKKDFSVQFKSTNDGKPLLERFTLVVLLEEQHVSGSPFLLQFVDQMGSNSDLTMNGKEVAVDAQHRMNVVLPHKTAEKLSVDVLGPEGISCDAAVAHWPGHAAAIAFTPSEAGEYKMHLTLNDKVVEGSPYSILANFSSEEAKQCYILEDDLHLFDKPILFGSDYPTFHVVTKTTGFDGEKTPSSENLSIICSGPGKASVQIEMDADFPGTESCSVIPCVPGNYKLTILWKEKHIQQSPITLKFRHFKNIVVCQGLEMSSQNFKVGQPYVFKLNSSDIGNKNLEVLCEPSSGGDISLELLNEEEHLYKCEINPLKAGPHSISVKCLGKDVEGSPFQIYFEDVANPLLCKLVEAVRDDNTKGNINVTVSTEGAGPGILEAVVQLVSQNGAIAQDNVGVTKSKVDDNKHQFQFNLGENVACLFHGSYNGRPIYGSPFKLVFGEMGKVRARGQGLAAGRVGEWNTFVLQAIGCNEMPEEKPQVTATGQESPAVPVEILPASFKPSLDQNGSLVSLASLESSIDYEVKYFAEAAGTYKLDVSWGAMPVPGSPFLVDCFLSIFEVQDPPEKLLLGSTMEFNIRNCSDERTNLAELTVDARSNKGHSVLGRISKLRFEDGDFDGRNVYKCSLLPQVAGKYLVSVKWKRLHIEGSPFHAKVLDPPRPDRVVVRGPGLQDGAIGKQEFVVETTTAGAGMLTMKVSRLLEEDRKEKIPLEILRDEDNQRTLHARYNPATPGEYVIEALWAGTCVPGSPFKVHILPYDRRVVVADIHVPHDDVVERNQWAEETTDIDGDSTVDHIPDAEWTGQDASVCALPSRVSSEISNHIEPKLDGDNTEALVDRNQWAEEKTEESNSQPPLDPQLTAKTTIQDSARHITSRTMSEKSNHIELEVDDNSTCDNAEEKTDIEESLLDPQQPKEENVSVWLPDRADPERSHQVEVELEGNDGGTMVSAVESDLTGTTIMNCNYSGEDD